MPDNPDDPGGTFDAFRDPDFTPEDYEIYVARLLEHMEREDFPNPTRETAELFARTILNANYGTLFTAPPTGDIDDVIKALDTAELRLNAYTDTKVADFLSLIGVDDEELQKQLHLKLRRAKFELDYIVEHHSAPASACESTKERMRRVTERLLHVLFPEVQS